ncbi:MAG: carbonic anhydrase [Thermodesulfobacteriota bacterium]
MTMRWSIALLALVAFLFRFPSPPAAGMEPVPKIRMGTPPNQIIEEILDVNAGARPDAGDGKGPLVTWLADCDSRLTSELISSRATGIYQVRNLGGQLAPALAEVDDGVLGQFTPVLLISGNPAGRAISLYLRRPASVSTELQRVFDGIAAAGAGLAPDETLQPARLAAAIVDWQVRFACRRYRDRIASGRLVVVGGIFDMDDNFGMGEGRLFLSNINGETDPDRMRAMPAASALGIEHLPRLGLPSLPAAGPEAEKKNPGGKPGSMHQQRPADQQRR